MRFLLVSTLALAACGDWVEYEDGAAPGAAMPGATADDLDEEVRMRFEQTPTLDHVQLEGLLSRYVSLSEEGTQTWFDYEGLANSPESLLALDQYLATLDLVKSSQLDGFEERFAYWLNAYNAAVIKGILDTWEGNPEYSVSEGLFVFFSQRAYSVGGVLMSLDELEHGVIRGDTEHSAIEPLPESERATLLALHEELWGDRPVDARLHMGVNCASFSCPNLAGTSPFAFRAATLDQQLARLTADFLDNPVKGAGPEGITMLFTWFARDFEVGYDGPADFIERWRTGGVTGVDLDAALDYDWSLNILP